MKYSEKTDHETREQVLKLLSHDEAARLSASKTSPSLADGDEYIDLAAPENGVRSVHGAMQLTMGDILPRKVVSAGTWAKITGRFGTRFAAKAPR
jgi:hypothetical protein